MLRTAALLTERSLPRASPECYTDHQDRSGTIRYTSVEDLQPGGDGAARVGQLEGVPHVEMPREHLKGSLIVPGQQKKANSVPVNIVLASGSGVTAIPEALAERLQMQFPATRLLSPIQECVRVVDGFHTE